MRTFKKDVVGLPFTGLPASVYHWRILFINSACLSVAVRSVLPGIENLDFIEPHQKDTAVSAALPIAINLHRGSPLNMQLHIAKSLFCHDAARSRRYSHHTVFYRPLCRGVVTL